MTKKRNIYTKYSQIIRELARRHGEAGTGFRISQGASLARCIGYTVEYIVKGNQIHYRYDKYERGLSLAFKKNPIREGVVIHIDIACGPGLFSWVVVDYLRSNPSVDVKTYGYDRAPNMVKLARLIWNQLDENDIFFCHHNINKLLRMVQQDSAERPYLLITFGHILVQTYNDDSALKNFARAVAQLAKLADCRLLAVDATSGDRPKKFRLACSRLNAAMAKCGLMVDNLHIDNSVMWTVARLGS